MAGAVRVFMNLPMLQFPLLLCVGLALPGLAAPSAPALQESHQVEHNAPLAIDDAPIDWVEFGSWLGQLQGPTQLERYLQARLLERGFARAELQLADAEIEAQVQAEIGQRVEHAFEGNRAAWLAELQRLGQSEASYLSERRREMRVELQQDLLVQARRVLTPESVHAAWEDRYGPGGRLMNVSRVFVRVRALPQPAGLTRDENLALNEQAKAEALARAEQANAFLEDGGSFADCVLEYSDDVRSRKLGGVLPRALVPEDWPGIDRDALRSWKVGETLGPFHSGGGYNIFRLDQISVTPLKSVAQALEAELMEAPADQTEVAQLRADLLAGAQIERLPELRRDVNAQSPRLQRPVAMLDGDALRREEFLVWLLADQGQNFARTFMEHRWAAAQAAQAGCEPTAVQVEQRVQEDTDHKIEAFFGGDRERWLQDLAGKGQTLENQLHLATLRTRHTLRAEGLLLRERVISEAMVRREWETRYGEGGHSLDVRLLMRSIPTPEEGVLETTEQIDAYIAQETRKALGFLAGLRERVQDGEDFGALVRTHSDDGLTRERGGRRASRFELHTWPMEIQAAVKELQAGEVTPPQAFGMDFFLFELAGKVHVPLADVAEELRAELQTRRPSAVEVAGYINSKTNGIRVDVLPGMNE